MQQVVRYLQTYRKANGSGPVISSYESGELPFRINNCVLYQFWNDENSHAFLLRNSSSGGLQMFRYPDDTLFTTFWQTSDENPLQGILSTVWDPEMEVTGPAVVRIEHR